MKENPVEGFKLTSTGEDLFKWNVAIFGAPGTIYQGGYFKAVCANFMSSLFLLSLFVDSQIPTQISLRPSWIALRQTILPS
jgi:hypothetical protein